MRSRGSLRPLEPSLVGPPFRFQLVRGHWTGTREQRDQLFDEVWRRLSSRNGYPDPYQAKARQALGQILNAKADAQRLCTTIEDCVAQFINDPPLSLCFDTPARQAEDLAGKLVALTAELRNGAKDLRSLRAYATQFEPETPVTEEDERFAIQNERGEGRAEEAHRPGECAHVSSPDPVDDPGGLSS